MGQRAYLTGLVLANQAEGDLLTAGQVAFQGQHRELRATLRRATLLDVGVSKGDDGGLDPRFTAMLQGMAS